MDWQDPSKEGFSFATSELGVVGNTFFTTSPIELHMHDPISVLDSFPLAAFRLGPLAVPSPLKSNLTILLLLALQPLRHLLPTPAAHEQTQEDLLRLLRVRVVDDDAAAEARLLRDRRDQLDLVVRRRVELQHGARGVPHRRVQRGEEAVQAVRRRRRRVRCFGVQQPLNHGDAAE
ncbi:hypothetical protein CVT25_006535 [Psilocybe cyanescens]|uniref:Uncharacterized protein n=1 Tax=Psilocybe cyanescens TaxID=93625 RepID=A0A409XEE8_PSICY|nr:hypothetical protein CVT25_006535 [Psilocybe cyanescens]